MENKTKKKIEKDFSKLEKNNSKKTKVYESNTKPKNKLMSKIDNNTKKNDKNIEKYRLREVIGIAVITAIVSFFMGFAINKKDGDANLSRYEKELLSNYRHILNNYYKNVEPRDLVSVAIKGMINYLDDPYADYISTNQMEDFNITVNGTYHGVGIQISYNESNEPIIVNVFENSPASNGGLIADDIIIAIEETNVLNMPLEEIKKMVTSYGDEEFHITYKRNGEENVATLKRDNVIINSVTTNIYDDKIGYIKLDNFASNSYNQFKNAIEELEMKKIDSLIIDLRNNTGGQLTAVENILSLFVDKKHVIYQMKEKEQITKYYSTGDKNRKYKIVILVNEYSASASELMAGTLKEISDATIIGVNTYGKGTAQEIVTLENGEQYKFTTKEWLTAEGNSIDGVGVEPNIKIEQSQEYYENPIEDNDEQLKKAIEYLK